MPRKIRQLKSDLKKAGFVVVKGRSKGSHTMWEHRDTTEVVNLSGHDGDDAEPYQERAVRRAIARAVLATGQDERY